MYVKYSRKVAAVEGRANRAEQSGATRTALLEAAHELFAERGYAGVGTEEIVQRAKVTRGALYHHFRDKRDLFRAVHEAVEAELARTIGEQMAEDAPPDAFAALRTGVRTFLDACTDPSMARIALVDAPSVLGWREWREIDERHGLGLVALGLRGAMDAGTIDEQPVRALSHLLLGAMGEAGMLIANAEDPQGTREEVEPALLALLDGLRSGY
jgi:AcrR family transcriptional regulator